MNNDKKRRDKKNIWRKGSLCPNCGKSKLESNKCKTKGHKHHVICKTCYASNF